MKYYIFGITPFAEMIVNYILDCNLSFGGYIVDKKYISDELTLKPVIAWEDFIQYENPENVEIIVAIGYNKMNTGRQKVFERIKSSGFRVGSFIHPSAIISSKCQLGEGNIILENVIIQPFVVCGNANIFWSNVNICHHTKIGNYNFFAASSCVLGKINIGDNCFIGCNSTIKNRISIGNKTLIGAGAFCSFDTSEEDVVVPVKSIKIDKKSTDLI